MKAKNKKYILKNRNKKSIEELAAELRVSENEIRKFLGEEEKAKARPRLSLNLPFWFQLVLVAAILIRLYLVFSTEGTYDVEIWERHASRISETGLIDYYKASHNEVITKFNHPPFAAFFATILLALGKGFGVPFKIIFRLPFALSDFITAFYLLRIFSGHKHRYGYTAFYLLNPVVFIMSAYHGNTDSMIGLLLVMSTYYLSQEKYWIAGLAFGFGTYFKWIIALAGPTMFLAIPGLKKRARFIAAIIGVFVLGYIWAFIRAPGAVFASVFNYGGLMIKTASGFIWGDRIIFEHMIDGYSRLFRFPSAQELAAFSDYFVKHDKEMIVVGTILYAWARRRRRSALEIGKTVAVIFTIFYALTNRWAFQYLAWSAPFWIFLGLPSASILTLFSSAYIYLFYSFVCQSPFLLGRWDLAAHSHLPGAVLFFRDISILSFMGVASFFFLRSLVGNLISAYKNIKERKAK